MSEDISLDQVPTVTMRAAHRIITRSIIQGYICAMYGGSGVGKTTMTDLLAATITPEMLTEHPAGDINHVVTYTGLAAPMYDGISIRGPIIAGESYDCAYTGRKRILSDLASPVWYTDIIELLAANPNAHIVVPIDEINLGMDDLHSNMLPLLDRKGLGPHQFGERDRKRISFLLMGNPPEALPSASNMSGPLALRVRKWFKVRADAVDICTFLEERGELAPEVEWTLKEYPELSEVPGVDDDGNIPELRRVDQSGDEEESEDTGFRTAIVNGVNPRKWHAVSLEMISMRHDPMYFEMEVSEKRDELRTMVHKQIADILVNAMEMADTFASMDQVDRDPRGAHMPDGMLLQSMQIRSLLPRITDGNVDNFIIYADRFNETSRSGIMSYLLRKLKQDQSKDSKTAGLMGGGSLKLSDRAIKALYKRYLGDLTNSVADAMGIEDIQIDVGATPAPEQVVAMQPPVPVPGVAQNVEANTVQQPQPPAPNVVAPPAAVAPVPVPVPQAVPPAVSPINAPNPSQAPAVAPSPSVGDDDDLLF